MNYCIYNDFKVFIYQYNEYVKELLCIFMIGGLA